MSSLYPQLPGDTAWTAPVIPRTINIYGNYVAGMRDVGHHVRVVWCSKILKMVLPSPQHHHWLSCCPNEAFYKQGSF